MVQITVTTYCGNLTLKKEQGIQHFSLYRSKVISYLAINSITTQIVLMQFLVLLFH